MDNLNSIMRSIRAIVVGSVFVIVVVVLMQLAYVFIAVGYNALAAEFQFLKDITGIFRYLLAFPILMITMFLGGYITADIANVTTKIKVGLHCFAMGFITVAGTMYFAMDNSDLTLTGIAVVILSISASSAGGLYWLRGKELRG